MLPLTPSVVPASPRCRRRSAPLARRRRRRDARRGATIRCAWRRNAAAASVGTAVGMATRPQRRKVAAADRTLAASKALRRRSRVVGTKMSCSPSQRAAARLAAVPLLMAVSSPGLRVESRRPMLTPMHRYFIHSGPFVDLISTFQVLQVR